MRYLKPEQYLLKNQSGSVLIMAVIMSIIIVILGTAFMKFVDHTRQLITWDIAESQARYAANAGILIGNLEYEIRGGLPDGYRSSTFRLAKNVNYDYEIRINNIAEYGLSTIIKYVVLGNGYASTYEFEDPIEYTVGWAAGAQSFADWLYLTDRETQEYRPAYACTLRFWGPDTLDGKVHSNDKLCFQFGNGGWPAFLEFVTSCSTRFSFDPSPGPPYESIFLGGYELGYSYIYLPNTADSVRLYNGITPVLGNPSPDIVTEITLDYGTIYVRYRTADSLSREDPSSWVWLGGADHYTLGEMYPVPSSGALFVDDELWIAAPKNKPHYCDPGGDVLNGFQGQLTIAASGDIIIAQDVVVASANPDGTVPIESEDLLGLISEKHILVWRHCPNTVNITAALAAVGQNIPDTSKAKICLNGQISEDGQNGTISMDGINCYGIFNEKTELFIFGCLIQRERGLIHTHYSPSPDIPQEYRGFESKDYKYDFRFKKTPPPHFLTTDAPGACYFENYRES